MLSAPGGIVGSPETGTSVHPQSVLLRPVRNPYYIVAPRYVRVSAGIKALHLLCHALNLAGERAYLIVHPYFLAEYAVNPDLLTPLLTWRLLQVDHARGLCPITIYPEVIKGNPLSAPFVVRYVLNYPGVLGGDKEFPEHEFCIAYSEALQRAVPRSKGALFIPTSDPNVFTPEPRVDRKGSCFYAGKYKHVHKGELFDVTRDSVEIHRMGSDAQTPEKIAELFRQSEVFYCYENTALAIEAVLCECPVVFLPNQYLDRVISVDEHGWDGMAWGTDPVEVDRAKRTVALARNNYLRLYDRFQQQLERFIEMTQEEVRKRPYVQMLQAPHLKPPGLGIQLIAAIQVLRSLVVDVGLLEAARMLIKRVLTRGVSLLP